MRQKQEKDANKIKEAVDKAIDEAVPTANEAII